jgi:hypothetical protein
MTTSELQTVMNAVKDVERHVNSSLSDIKGEVVLSLKEKVSEELVSIIEDTRAHSSLSSGGIKAIQTTVDGYAVEMTDMRNATGKHIMCMMCMCIMCIMCMCIMCMCMMCMCIMCMCIKPSLSMFYVLRIKPIPHTPYTLHATEHTVLMLHDEMENLRKRTKTMQETLDQTKYQVDRDLLAQNGIITELKGSQRALSDQVGVHKRITAEELAMMNVALQEGLEDGISATSKVCVCVCVCMYVCMSDGISATTKVTHHTPHTIIPSYHHNTIPPCHHAIIYYDYIY